MTVTITHIYDDYESAENVVRELESSGLTSDQISVVGRKPAVGAGDESVEGAATGATLGGVTGAGAGLLASLGLIAIPGIGPTRRRGRPRNHPCGSSDRSHYRRHIGRACRLWDFEGEGACLRRVDKARRDACLGPSGGDEGRSGGAYHAAPRADGYREWPRLPGAGLAEPRPGRAILHGKGAARGARPRPAHPLNQ